MGKLVLICVIAVLLAASTIATAQAEAHAPAPSPTHQTRAFGAFKIIGCVLGVGAFIAGDTALVLKVKRIGGIVKFAKMLWHAKSAEKRAEVVAKAFGTLSGVGGLIASPASAPSSRILSSTGRGSLTASAWIVMLSAPAW